MIPFLEIFVHGNLDYFSYLLYNVLIMSERVEIGINEWRDLSSDELGFTGSQLKTEEHRYVAENGQAFNVFIADARPDGVGPTYLTSTSFDYRMDTLLKRGTSILATQSGSRVAVSEVPGITYDYDNPFHSKGAWQTPRQSLTAFTGNFDSLSLMQLEAFDKYLKFQDGDEIQVGGRSLAAYMAASMLRNIAQHKFPKRLKVSRVDFVEPVNAFGNHSLARQWKILGELASYEERMRTEVYIPENEQIGHTTPRFEDESELNDRILKHVRRTQFAATYLTGAGLRKGIDHSLVRAMADKTNDGIGLHDADITFARGDASHVSFEKDLVAAREEVRRVGSDAKIITLTDESSGDVPLAHHALDSLGRIASYAQQRNTNFSA